jgi:acyl-CoA synthetase (AMP-forming)/AMP-acid ligase II
VEKVANSHPQVSESAVYGVVMPDSDGRAGMASIVIDQDIRNFDLRELAGLFERSLPHYARPKFLRIKKEFDTTATHKIKKKTLKEEGFDPARVTDPLYVQLPGESSYQPLTPEIHKQVLTGRFKF